MKKIITWILCAFVMIAALGISLFFLFPGDDEEEGYYLYYLNQEEDALVQIRGKAEESDSNALVAELYLLQQMPPEGKKNAQLGLLLPADTTLLNFALEEGLLSLNFSSGYLTMDREREILVRAGMVRLFSQIQGVKKIQFFVEDQPLRNAEGIEIGSLTAGRFVENSGKEINSYMRTTMVLYFTDSSGTKLVPEERNVYYNSNVPIEKVVVEQLVKGPKNMENRATLPSELNILSVTIQEGICYVNLDDSFKNLLEISSSVLDPELAVYSIVNSLAEVCGVNKVQISVGGTTNITIGGMQLETLYTDQRETMTE